MPDEKAALKKLLDKMEKVKEKGKKQSETENAPTLYPVRPVPISIDHKNG